MGRQPPDVRGPDEGDVDVNVVLFFPIPPKRHLLTVRRERRPIFCAGERREPHNFGPMDRRRSPEQPQSTRQREQSPDGRCHPGVAPRRDERRGDWRVKAGAQCRFDGRGWWSGRSLDGPHEAIAASWHRFDEARAVG
jgi:hypothetical protein